LLRTFLILALLVVSGIIFERLTQRSSRLSDDKGKELVVHSDKSLLPAKIYLSLSQPVGFLEMKIGDSKVELARAEQWNFVGNCFLDPSRLHVELKTLPGDPKKSGAARMFAKLVVEANGKKTFTHVFDAEGDINDFAELPF
jgi:hypothetical protein